MIAWLSQSIDGTSNQTLAPLLLWHGRAMVLAWGFLIPLGILVARYWKIWPGQDWPRRLDHPGWWHSHRVLQSAALVLMSVGTYMAWQETSQFANRSGWAQNHAMLGWGLIIAAWAQVLGALVRGSKGGPSEPHIRGDHFDMTTWRRCFEWSHKLLGWGSLVVASGTIVIGLVLAHAPRWMWLLILGWWVLLFLLAMRWQRQGRCIDTYQAIWGDDQQLPGLQMRPIGWGIRRRVPHRATKPSMPSVPKTSASGRATSSAFPHPISYSTQETSHET